MSATKRVRAEHAGKHHVHLRRLALGAAWRAGMGVVEYVLPRGNARGDPGIPM
jgi:hypothetical protein